MALESFYELFENMSISVLMCLISGLILVVIEFFCSSPKNILGVTGGVLIVAGIAMRMFFGGTTGVFFALLFLLALVLFLCHIVMLLVQKRNWLLHSLSLELQGSQNNARNYIKNLTGIATTEINPTGHIAIGEINFFVSASEFIEKGSVVKVVEADGDKIVVKPFENLTKEL